MKTTKVQNLDEGQHSGNEFSTASRMPGSRATYHAEFNATNNTFDAARGTRSNEYGQLT